MVQVMKISSAFGGVNDCLSTGALPIEEPSPTLVKEIVSNFIQHLKYRPADPFIPVETTTTYKSLCSEFSAYDNGGKWFEAIRLESSTMAEVSQIDGIQIKSVKFDSFLILTSQKK